MTSALLFVGLSCALPPAFAEGKAPAVEASSPTAPAVAASTPAVPSSTPTAPPAEPQVSTFTARSPEPPPAAELIDRVRRLDEELKTLKASFRQTLETQAGLKQNQAGRLFYRKPDRLRLEFDEPRRQVTFSDKKTLWVHQVQDKQVIRADWEDWKKSQSQLTGLLEFGQYSTLLSKHDASVQPYRLEASTEPVAGSWRLTLRPRGSSLYTLHLVLSEPDYLPRRAELEMERMKIVNELSDVEINAEIDPSTFEFKPPDDLPVIDLSAP